MGFWLRAALVIGLIAAFAPGRPAEPERGARTGAADPADAAAATAAQAARTLAALPPDLRERVLREGTAEAGRALDALLRGSLAGQRGAPTAPSAARRPIE
ncbi:hypothetical protein [Methylobacterium isbiliense]|jgi:hypothetical protein|uniref:Uncharacterized protein n=1 Tax=Methylobacterium isbiliense TaxID=315478 RepID=A0ABQ4S9R7_9HYPH|nr:hypothetical protein [Methylobacterium isbiliense]MDN3622173.1 hypothetical protein [Methylobacterium isbiliense]GJD98538.1 hypothetical protein GMJLKIPL_0449 [Methylobacterium isbiliense]